jgi:hypothetical protein
MKKNEYEMPPEYHRHTEMLLELLEKREYIEKKLRELPLLLTEEMKLEKIEIDRQIELFENSLAVQYEAVQLQKKLEDTQNQLHSSLIRRTMEMYINIKHKAPNLLEGFEKLIYENFSPEDAETYLDEVAIMETTRLDEILGNEK